MEIISNNETVINLLAELGIGNNYAGLSLSRLANVNSKFIKDLKLNVTSFLSLSNYTRKEAYLIALSVAVNEKNLVLIEAFENLAENEGANAEEIAETHACTALMNTNNVLYRFRHFLPDVVFYNNQPAGIRMSSMINPVMGKSLFELISLVISAVNGCELCVVAHEHSVKEQGASEQRIYDAVRLGAIITSLCTII